MMMIKSVFFILLSIPLVIVSWRSLFNPRNHGLYRFLSWECIILLAVNNIEFWFRKPFSINQVFSWLFLIFSLYLVVVGAIMMKKSGKPLQTRKDGSLYTFEKTTTLVEKGIFKYIRHPLYSSLLFLTWGIYLKNPEIPLSIFTVASTVFLYLTARFEEKENISYFGDEYKAYMAGTKMFIPFIF